MLDSNKRCRKFVDLGLEIVARFSGTIIGAKTGDLSGALLGQAVTAIALRPLKCIGEDFCNRQLSIDEKRRVAAELILIKIKIEDMHNQGKSVRTDGFFDGSITDRSSAAEIFEGITLIAQKEYEQKKLPFFANLVANICFNPNIDRGNANLLLRLAEQLSYRQLCILSLFGLSDKPPELPMDSYSDGEFDNEGIASKRHDLLEEAFELHTRSLVARSDNTAILDIYYIAPGIMQLIGTGRNLYELMELRDIPRSDVEELVPMFEQVRPSDTQKE